MKSLKQLKTEILEDGIIDAVEVKEIESVIYEDGKIDKEEADFLFELNDAVSGKRNHESWEELFIRAIASFVLDDDISNGEIDEDEAIYLFDKIKGDGKIDDIEMNLLNHLKFSVSSFPTKLNELL
jgi:hypothetical protein|tara:strand:+ start:61 stop:438 length:378 start_codon:yes stop_codon:yes gene_type:complete